MAVLFEKLWRVNLWLIWPLSRRRSENNYREGFFTGHFIHIQRLASQEAARSLSHRQVHETGGNRGASDSRRAPGRARPAGTARSSLSPLLTLCVVALSTAVHLYHVERSSGTPRFRESRPRRAVRSIPNAWRNALSPHLRGPPDRSESGRRSPRSPRRHGWYAPWLLYSLSRTTRGWRSFIAIASGRESSSPHSESQKVVNDDPLRRLFDGSRQSRSTKLRFPSNVNGKPVATIRLGIAMSLLRGRLDDAFWYTVTLGCLSLAAALVVAVGLSSVTLKAHPPSSRRHGAGCAAASSTWAAARGRRRVRQARYQLQLLGKQMGVGSNPDPRRAQRDQHRACCGRSDRGWRPLHHRGWRYPLRQSLRRDGPGPARPGPPRGSISAMSSRRITRSGT